ncbi:lipocalin-like domain-containing protein [Flavivirga rizhaonensis]|uniref:Lipocalin-like domain-containing protein n=1 Tax=Flavivirga rizhaonensis TaxID=2559571 RepID=A0A4S1DU31_9FLAO|nr:lipocalin family protein [Flavivirga rizhaonensis]TGV01571.1 hypothetical protein EM932_14920 [Flavivirga rizhaonensis]
MKTLKLTLLTIITACLTFSCSSDDDSPTKSNAELIIGTWKWTEETEDGTNEVLDECDLLDTLTFTDTQVSYVSHFKENQNATTCSSITLNDIYSINGNSITSDVELADTNTYEIVTLNSTTLVLKFEETFNNETTVYTNTFVKQ